MAEHGVDQQVERRRLEQQAGVADPGEAQPGRALGERLRIDRPDRGRDVFFLLHGVAEEPPGRLQERFLARRAPDVSERAAVMMALVIPGVGLNLHGRGWMGKVLGCFSVMVFACFFWVIKKELKHYNRRTLKHSIGR